MFFALAYNTVLGVRRIPVPGGLDLLYVGGCLVAIALALVPAVALRFSCRSRWC